MDVDKQVAVQVLLERLSRYIPGWTFTALAVGGTLAYATQPLVRFSEPGRLALGGYILALALLLTIPANLIFDRASSSVILRVFGFVMFLVGLPVFIGALTQGRAESAFNDRRCAAVQTDMLSASPRRSDDTAVFQALGCRPQGNEMPRYPAPPHVPYQIDKPPIPTSHVVK